MQTHNHIGIRARDGDKYFATALGQRLNDLAKRSPDFVDVLPPHSEGHEEKALAALLKEPKTHETLTKLIPAGTVARVLNRLQSLGLVTTTKENDYVFFFKTQRDPNKESFSPTEKKVYENILEEGTSARRLAQTTDITLRRTYKYLRRLKGKKMIFTRERPKAYALTEKGVQLATVLQSMQDLTREVFEAAAQVLDDGKSNEFITTTSQTRDQMRQKTVLTN